MNKDYLIERTKEVEKALDKKFEELGFGWGDCMLDMHPEFPCDKFFAECRLTFMENGEPFVYLGAFKEDVISLPNDEAVDKILEIIINGTKKKLEKVKKNGNLKSLENTIENILKRLESSRR